MSELQNCCGTTCDKQKLLAEIRQMVIDAFLDGVKYGHKQSGQQWLGVDDAACHAAKAHLNTLNLSEK